MEEESNVSIAAEDVSNEQEEVTNHIEEHVTEEPVKKGTKRKSSSSVSGTPAKMSKIPRYEPEDVKLEAKTVYIANNEKYLSRHSLTTIPPGQGAFSVGDLVWARIQGFCFWPAIISIDPESGMSCKADRIYHVQFFGPSPSRGWPTIGSFFAFEGIDKFYERIESELASVNSKQAQKVMAKFIVKPAMKKAWNHAVAEAIEASKLDRAERVRQLTFIYAFKGESKTPKRTSEASAPKSAKASTGAAKSAKKSKKRNSVSKKSSPEDVYNFDEDSEGGEVLGKLNLKNRNAKGDFQVYVRKHFDDESKSNPNLTKAQVTSELKQRWNKMSSYERSFYVERKALFEDESNMLVSKRANLGDDYGFSDDDEDDFKDDRSKASDSPSENNKQQNDENPATKTQGEEISIRSASKSKRAKSKKSEKLFAMIIEGGESCADAGEACSTSTTPKAKKNSQPKTKTPKSKAKSVSAEKSKPKSSSKAENSTPSGATLKKYENRLKKKLFDIGESEAEQSDGAASRSSISSKKSDSKNNDCPNVVDAFCQLCHYDDNAKPGLVKCNASCQRYYHKTCIDLDDSVVDFCCEECTNGKYKCFECKQYETNDAKETLKCQEARCNRYYHFACIENYAILANKEKDKFTCPLHACNNCHVESMLSTEKCEPRKRRLVQCIACPLAFHPTKHCIAAGTTKLSPSLVVCPNHYQPGKLQKKGDRQVNVNHCFACLQEGGQLICCESCPAAFHEKCIEQSFDSEKSFFCSDCQLRRSLHYGDIVWVKYAAFRWWPGKICRPKDIPENVANAAHNDGDFPVYFYGTHNYQWLNKGRTYRYEEGDGSNLNLDSGKKMYSKSLGAFFKKALVEVSEAHKEWLAQRHLQQQQRKPQSFTSIASNRYLNRSNGNGSNSNKLEPTVCECSADDKGEYCSDESCLNRAILTECDPKMCPGKEKCLNQRLLKNQHKKCEYFLTQDRGWGLRTLENIKKGDFVIEYVGEVIDRQELDKRMTDIANDNYYFLVIDRNNIIDARFKGNLSRFINHSCEPTLETQKWLVDHRTRVGLFAIDDIAANTELTFNYQFNYEFSKSVTDKPPLKCNCGADKCTGFIGMKPETKNTNGEKSSKQRNGKIRKKGQASPFNSLMDEHSNSPSPSPSPHTQLNGHV